MKEKLFTNCIKNVKIYRPSNFDVCIGIKNVILLDFVLEQISLLRFVIRSKKYISHIHPYTHTHNCMLFQVFFLYDNK